MALVQMMGLNLKIIIYPIFSVCFLFDENIQLIIYCINLNKFLLNMAVKFFSF